MKLAVLEHGDRRRVRREARSGLGGRLVYCATLDTAIQLVAECTAGQGRHGARKNNAVLPAVVGYMKGFVWAEQDKSARRVAELDIVQLQTAEKNNAEVMAGKNNEWATTAEGKAAETTVAKNSFEAKAVAQGNAGKTFAGLSIVAAKAAALHTTGSLVAVHMVGHDGMASNAVVIVEKECTGVFDRRANTRPGPASAEEDALVPSHEFLNLGPLCRRSDVVGGLVGCVVRSPP